MVKNALQAQLLKAGLVDNKKAKKLSKQAQHEQRTGQSNEAELKAHIEQNQKEKQQWYDVPLFFRIYTTAHTCLLTF